MGKLKPILLSTVMALGATPLMAQEEQFITIGTGGQTGVYYVVGQSICRLVNRDTATTGLRCTARDSTRPRAASSQRWPAPAHRHCRLRRSRRPR